MPFVRDFNQKNIKHVETKKRNRYKVLHVLRKRSLKFRLRCSKCFNKLILFNLPECLIEQLVDISVICRIQLTRVDGNILVRSCF